MDGPLLDLELQKFSWLSQLRVEKYLLIKLVNSILRSNYAVKLVLATLH